MWQKMFKIIIFLIYKNLLVLRRGYFMQGKKSGRYKTDFG